MEYLSKLWQAIKARFISNGGFTGPKNILFLLLSIYGLYTIAKTKGLLPHKSLKDKHIFITGAGMGLGRLMAIALA